MVTKGIIKTIDFTSNTCTVRLPLFETAGNVTEMTIPATFSITPGIYNSYKEGDVVEVAFDNGELQNPVVVGKLYLGTNKESQEYRGSANFSDLTVKNSVTLPIDTKFSVDPGNNTIEKVKGGNNSIKSVNDIIYNIQDLNKKIVDQEIQNDGLYLTKNNSGQTSGFGWSLNADSWKLTSYQPNQSPLDIFVANKDGVTIQGDLTLVGQPSTAKDVYAYIEAKNYTENKDGFVVDGKAVPPDYSSIDEINNNWYSKEEIDDFGNWDKDKNQPKTPDGWYLWKLTYITMAELDNNGEAHQNITSANVILLSDGNSGGPLFSDEATTVKVIAQGKSTNYYSSSDPTSEQGGSYSVKEGDCWFKTGDNYKEYSNFSVSDKDKYLDGNYYYKYNNNYFQITEGNIDNLKDGDIIYTKDNSLYQWDGENWADIGGELVANKVTANYINAMDITAKKIEILDSNNDTIFLADGTTNDDNNKVKISGLTASSDKLSFLEESDKNAFILQNTEQIFNTFQPQATSTLEQGTRTWSVIKITANENILYTTIYIKKPDNNKLCYLVTNTNIDNIVSLPTSNDIDVKVNKAIVSLLNLTPQDNNVNVLYNSANNSIIQEDESEQKSTFEIVPIINLKKNDYFYIVFTSFGALTAAEDKDIIQNTFKNNTQGRFGFLKDSYIFNKNNEINFDPQEKKLTISKYEVDNLYIKNKDKEYEIDNSFSGDYINLDIDSENYTEEKNKTTVLSLGKQFLVSDTGRLVANNGRIGTLNITENYLFSTLYDNIYNYQTQNATNITRDAAPTRLDPYFYSAKMYLSPTYLQFTGNKQLQMNNEEFKDSWGNPINTNTEDEYNITYNRQLYTKIGLNGIEGRQFYKIIDDTNYSENNGFRKIPLVSSQTFMARTAEQDEDGNTTYTQIMTENTYRGEYVKLAGLPITAIASLKAEIIKATEDENKDTYINLMPYITKHYNEYIKTFQPYFGLCFANYFGKDSSGMVISDAEAMNKIYRIEVQWNKSQNNKISQLNVLLKHTGLYDIVLFGAIKDKIFNSTSENGEENV